MGIDFILASSILISTSEYGKKLTKTAVILALNK